MIKQTCSVDATKYFFCNRVVNAWNKLATLSYKSRMTGQPDYLAAELRSYINHSSVYVRRHMNC